MEGRQVARVPSLAESRSPQIPVGADLARRGPQVMPEVDDRRPAAEPIAVIDAVDDQSGLEHECVRNHRIMLRVGILRDVEVLLNRSFGVGEEGPLGPADARNSWRVWWSPVEIVAICVCHSDFRIKRGKFQMLLARLRAVMAARKRQDQGISALEFAEAQLGYSSLDVQAHASCHCPDSENKRPSKARSTGAVGPTQLIDAM